MQVNNLNNMFCFSLGESGEVEFVIYCLSTMALVNTLSVCSWKRLMLFKAEKGQ